MIYVHAVSRVNIKEDETFDVKDALKEIQTKPFRRTDRFIQLALLGANKALIGRTVSEETALCMVSGQGNLAVFNRLRYTRYIQKQAPKPVDFINSLSNTAGFYVAQSLKLHSKNLSLSNHKFGVEMALVLAQNDLLLKKEKQVLLGGVDELLKPLSFTKNFLGVVQSQRLGEGSNWLLLNTQAKDALASLEVYNSSMDLEKVVKILTDENKGFKLAFGNGCEDVSKILKMTKAQEYKYKCDYYETQGFYVINTFIEEEEGVLMYLSSFEGRFRLVKVNTLAKSTKV